MEKRLKHHLQKFLVECIIMLLLMGLMGGNAGGQDKKMIELKNFQWKNRLLLIFTPSADDFAYQSLAAGLNTQKTEVVVRDLLVGEIYEIGVSQFAAAPLHPQSAETLRKRFATRNGLFTVILIGKDGEIKLRREASVQLAEIFSLIDSMPMRQQEMRERK